MRGMEQTIEWNRHAVGSLGQAHESAHSPWPPYIRPPYFEPATRHLPHQTLDTPAQARPSHMYSTSRHSYNLILWWKNGLLDVELAVGRGKHVFTTSSVYEYRP